MAARFLVIFGACFLLMSSAQLYRFLDQRSDIWWTPHALLVPLAESQDRVEVYARGRPLRGLLEAGQIRVADDGGSAVLMVSEVGFRFNNWDRVRAERIPVVLVHAMTVGAAAVVLVVGLVLRISSRRAGKAVAA